MTILRPQFPTFLITAEVSGDNPVIFVSFSSGLPAGPAVDVLLGLWIESALASEGIASRACARTHDDWSDAIVHLPGAVKPQPSLKAILRILEQEKLPHNFQLGWWDPAELVIRDFWCKKPSLPLATHWPEIESDGGAALAGENGELS